MISFRYHVVSVIAVFLALALGIVVGTTALNGPITKNLRNQVDAAKKQKAGLAAQVKALQGQVDDAGKFATTYGNRLVSGSLTGRSVLVVAMPNVPAAMLDGIESQLTASGATVGGQVSLTSGYLASNQSNDIITLASSTHPLGLTLPKTSDPGRIGGALLSYVLLGKGSQTDLTQVLGGFAQLHMIEVKGDTVSPSSSIVVVGPGGLGGNRYGGEVELGLVSALSQAGGHVTVAGDTPSASRGGIVALVRHDDTVRNTVATVDDAGNAFGQVSTVLALSAQIKGQVGQYGTQNGADALFPPVAS